MYGKDSESLKSYKTILSPIRGPNQKKLKINKSTLWYEQKKIKEEKTINIYKKTRGRIE